MSWTRLDHISSLFSFTGNGISFHLNWTWNPWEGRRLDFGRVWIIARRFRWRTRTWDGRWATWRSAPTGWRRDWPGRCCCCRPSRRWRSSSASSYWSASCCRTTPTGSIGPASPTAGYRGPIVTDLWPFRSKTKKQTNKPNQNETRPALHYRKIITTLTDVVALTDSSWWYPRSDLSLAWTQPGPNWAYLGLSWFRLSWRILRSRKWWTKSPRLFLRKRKRYL